MSDRPLSANERIKENSRFLRGTIAEGLTVPETGAIADDDQQLTKFHGIYLQDDRDLRAGVDIHSRWTHPIRRDSDDRPGDVGTSDRFRFGNKE